MTRRLWIATIFTVPLFLLAMSEMIPGDPVWHALGQRAIAWIELALATPVVLWVRMAVLRARLGVAPSRGISTCSR